jgi:TetR/AcrR family transcriptional regulator, cholesterol catabolism regulator
MTVSDKRARKVEQIHAAAARLFAERGFHATRMADIAAELDMQAGSLYHYAASKEDLLVAIVESRVGIAVEALRDILAGDGTVTDKMRRGVAAHLRAFQDDADIYSIFNFERLADISPEVAEQVDRRGRHYEALWADLVARGVETGELRVDIDVRVTVKAIVGLCNSTLLWFRPGGRLTIDEVADEFAALVLGGLVAG